MCFIIDGVERLLLSSQVIVGVGLHVARMAIDFRKTSLQCLSNMSCKISRPFRGWFVAGTNPKY